MVEPAVVLEDQMRIPAGVHDFACFRRWTHSPDFPAGGRIDFLDGDVEVEMSPEGLYSHGAVKAEIAAELQILIGRARRGSVFVDRARVVVPEVGLSVEPDVTVALDASRDAGRFRLLPGASGDFVEIEGPPDLVVEVVSRSSVGKDTRRLPSLYARAGITELWRVDARGDGLSFELFSLVAPSYEPVPEEEGGWRRSAVVERSVRLTRAEDSAPYWSYRLETRALESYVEGRTRPRKPR